MAHQSARKLAVAQRIEDSNDRTLDNDNRPTDISEINPHRETDSLQIAQKDSGRAYDENFFATPRKLSTKLAIVPTSPLEDIQAKVTSTREALAETVVLTGKTFVGYHSQLLDFEGHEALLVNSRSQVDMSESRQHFSTVASLTQASRAKIIITEAEGYPINALKMANGASRSATRVLENKMYDDVQTMIEEVDEQTKYAIDMQNYEENQSVASRQMLPSMRAPIQHWITAIDIDLQKEKLSLVQTGKTVTCFIVSTIMAQSGAQVKILRQGFIEEELNPADVVFIASENVVHAILDDTESYHEEDWDLDNDTLLQNKILRLMIQDGGLLYGKKLDRNLKAIFERYEKKTGKPVNGVCFATQHLDIEG